MSDNIGVTKVVQEVVTIEQPYNVVTVEQGNTIVILENTDVVTSEIVESKSITTVGSQGPPGIPGSAFTYEVAISGSIMGGHRMVTTNALGKLIYADNTISSHANKVMGIITNATNIDELVNVYITGTITENSWAWDINEPLYLSTNGQITQVPPSTGFLLIIGFPITSTKIFLDKIPPIILA